MGVRFKGLQCMEDQNLFFFGPSLFFEFIKIQHLKVFVVILDGSLAQCKYLSLRHLHH